MQRDAESAAAMPRTLTTLATLDFAAASGLVSAHGALWVIADDGLALQQLSCTGAAIAQHALFPGQAALPTEAKARKKAKPDLEALCLLPDGRLLALGSGSRRDRARCSVFDVATAHAQVIDASPLYEALEEVLPELNIEGACVVGDRLLLAHRGNSEGAADALLLLDLQTLLIDVARGQLTAKAQRGQMPVQLGTLDGARLTLTDLATDGEGQLWFSAAAERTQDRYDDGPCAGSVIGCFDAALVPTRQWRVPGRLKIEGLASAGAQHWWLVADADNPGVPSPLLSLVLA